MSAIQQAIVATAGGSLPPPTVTFDHISDATANEGATVYVYYNYSNFNGETVYWSIAYDINTCDRFNFTGATDGYSQLYGSNFSIFQIHPKANHVTSGSWNYSIWLGSTQGGAEYGSFGPYTVNDTSTTPSTSLVFDIDPANITDTTMSFGAPFNCPDTGEFGLNGLGYYATKSADYGGTLLLDANVGARVQLPDLTYSNYQSVTISAWIKSPAIGATQTILAKELCYNLRIGGDGSLSWATSSSGNSWTNTEVSSGGAIQANHWYHVTASVDVSHVTLYLNGTQLGQHSGLTLGRNNNPLVIGAYGDGYGIHDFFTGSMGEVKMWNFALTDSDVANEYNNTKSRYLPPTYSFGAYDLSVDEGSSITVNVTTANVPDGTTLYWTIDFDPFLGNTADPTDFGVTSGSFNIASSAGSFTVSPLADGLTEGAQFFKVQVRTVSTGGTVVLTSDYITINDTSTGTRAPVAYLFVGDGGHFQLSNTIYPDIPNLAYNSSNQVNILKGGYPQPQVGWKWTTAAYDPNWRTITNVVDNDPYWTITIDPGGSAGALTTTRLSNNTNSQWALGTTWTIEFWSKPTIIPGVNGAPGDQLTVLSQNTDLNVQNNNGWNNLDVEYVNGGNINFANSYAGFTIPSPHAGVWSHIAISSDSGHVRGYVDGQKVYDHPDLNINFTNGADDLYIGKAGTISTNSATPFNGELTDIRISNIARYTGTSFDPATTSHPPTTDSNTQLIMTPTQDSLFGSVQGHQLIYSGVQFAVDYPHIASTLSDNNGTTVGNITYVFGNTQSTETVPVGASITSTMAGFGVRTVVSNAPAPYGRLITYDATGLSGSTTGETYTYYW